MERGKDLMTATLTAARLRLRPILMTSFAFILGCVPLVTAAGSGALARNSIGIVVVVGMSIATALGVFFIPCSFVFVMRLFRSRIEKAHHGADPDEVYAYVYEVTNGRRNPAEPMKIYSSWDVPSFNLEFRLMLRNACDELLDKH